MHSRARIFRFALSVVAIVATLAGCGSDADDVGPSGTTASGNATLTTAQPMSAGRHRAATEDDAAATKVPSHDDADAEDPGMVSDPDLDPEIVAASIELLRKLAAASPGGAYDFLMPTDSRLDELPQDPSNPVTPEKVVLGKMLFHDTALGLDGNSPSHAATWSCASCHHHAAGFKSGIAQGIGEGGEGFGTAGRGRHMAAGMDSYAAADAVNKPDVQPLASPSILNSAWQAVMLWNGQFGNASGGPNEGVDPSRLETPGTPKQENARALPGIEIQAIAGLGVHRLSVASTSPLQTNPTYRALFDAAYPDGSDDVLQDAGKAIAAYERSVIANRAPFQRWLNGDWGAMSLAKLRGANLFFGKAGCVACHRGPALSSDLHADADAMFFAVGFGDFDLADPQIHGPIAAADRLGRGNLTGRPGDDYKFKVPQLYNLADAPVYGHGASFASIYDLVDYKNLAQPQQTASRANLDPRFRPLGLDAAEIDDLANFLIHGLKDPDLARYAPTRLPTGACSPVADDMARAELGC